MEFLEVFPEDEIMAGIVDLGLCVTRFFYSFLTIDLENGCVVQLVMYFFFFIR